MRNALTLGCQLSKNGKGRWQDNVFVERFWKSIKYGEVFLHTNETVLDAKAEINRHVGFCNGLRPPSSLGKKTSNEARAAFATTIKLAREAISPSIVQLEA